MSRNRIVKSYKFKARNRESSFCSLRLKAYSFVFCFLVFICYITCFAQEEFVYDSKGKRNPFVPLVTPDGKLLKLDDGENSLGIALEGIIYDEKGVSYAIVNQEVVKVSDMVGEYQVLKIERSRVVFVKDGEPLEIELKKEE